MMAHMLETNASIFDSPVTGEQNCTRVVGVEREWQKSSLIIENVGAQETDSHLVMAYRQYPDNQA